MSPRTRLPGLAVVAVVATAASAPAVSASPTSTSTAKARATNCVGGPTGTPRCFSTFRAAIRHATHGQVTDAPKSARAAARDRGLRSRLRRLTIAPRTTGPTAGGRATPRAAADGGEIIAATLFDDQDYGGSSYTVTAGAPCKKDGLIEWQIDLPEDWQNRVSSVQPWGNCWIWLYPELGLNGDRDGPFDQNTPYVGAQLDNRTKSVGLS
jgi:hypothetical protein